MTAAITSQIDVALIVLYLFFAFFAGLIFYLLQEGKREGFPLETGTPGEKAGLFFPPIPEPKEFRLRDGTVVKVPNFVPDDREVKARPVEHDFGTAYEPTGNPLVDAVGPAAYAERADEPDRTMDGAVKIRPISSTKYEICEGDPTLVGYKVIAGDGQKVGTIKEAWVDQSESMIRYLEIDLGEGVGTRLAPMTLSVVSKSNRSVTIKSLMSNQFADVPALKAPDRVTLLEEDKISAYYSGGHLYGSPDRFGPLL